MLTLEATFVRCSCAAALRLLGSRATLRSHVWCAEMLYRFVNSCVQFGSFERVPVRVMQK